MDLKFNLDKQNVFVTSDSHYNHKNICRGVSSWEDNKGNLATRDFPSLEEMNQTIVDGINDRVKSDDILIHLGDWSFGGIQNIAQFREQINCKNIYLCYGNHDHHIKNNRLLETSTHRGVPAKELFIETGDILNLTVTSSVVKGKVQFFCSHYSHRIWDKRHHGRMHLFGHSHGSLDSVTNDRSMDVGIDSSMRIFGTYMPFHIMEVYTILENRENFTIDHHSYLTN